MPLGESASERAPGTRSEKTAIAKPAGSRMRSSGSRPAWVDASSGAEQASRRKTANLSFPMAAAHARSLPSRKDQPDPHRHHRQGGHLPQGHGLAKEDPAEGQGHEVADPPLEGLDGADEHQGQRQ